MCGIVGQINLNAEPVSDLNIRKMVDAVAHRGPDDAGIFIKRHVGIGFRRLSIMDTEGGRQPIYNEDNSIVLVTNGEIYNYQELRSKMIAKGHTFKTRSDVEVIVHLYEEYGDKFIDYLNGMYSICLYDIRNDLMILARDRMGIKPFYFLRTKKGIYFGSEIKGILASGEVESEKEEAVLEEFLVFRSLSNNRTFFRNIRSLGPGELMVINHGNPWIKKYYTQDYHPIDVHDGDLPETVYRKLNDSVTRQLMSDVPVGTLLSGGVDSSFVTAVAASQYPNIKSFTVGFEDGIYDESRYARIVSGRFHTEYHEIKIGNEEFADHLPKAIWYHDEPLNHANSVQLYLISKYARQFVKVLLTGEGADEIFGGYPRYQINRLGLFLDSLGQKRKQWVIKPLAFIKSRKAKKLAWLLKYSLNDMIIMNSAFIRYPDWIDLLPNWEAAVSERQKVLGEVVSCTDDYLNQLLFFEQRTYLQSILARTDKMSMAASVEARVPFLDNEVVALANTIPGRDKLRLWRPKFLLKESAKTILPAEIVGRRKVGFGVPIASWLRNPKGLGRFLDPILEDEDIGERLSKRRLEQMVMEHKTSAADHAEILWPLINYSIWNGQFFNN